jgi:hypothetical protein
MAKVGLIVAGAFTWFSVRILRRIAQRLRLDREYARWRAAVSQQNRTLRFLTFRVPDAILRLRALGYRPSVAVLVDELLAARRQIPTLHTSACGAFLLTDIESWHRMRGMPELSTSRSTSTASRW